MKRILQLATLTLAGSLLGCAVRDGHEDEAAPIWWPNFLYHASTHPTTEESQQASGMSTAPLDATASARDVRGEWNPIYNEHPITPLVTPLATPDMLSRPIETESSASATLYPNRGQAALAANSATLYPPTNEFSGGPAGNASILPRGPLAPTGYLGR